MKTLTIRIFPTEEQEKLIWRHIGACRFIWNWSLEKQIEEYNLNKHRIGHTKICKELTRLKLTKEFNWLNEISITSLQQSLRELDRAYNDCFVNGKGFPKFKRKKDIKKSYPVESRKFYFDGEYVQIIKLGRVKFRSSYKFNLPNGNHAYRFRNARIHYKNNKWLLTFVVGDDICDTQANISRLNDYSVGIDLGVKDLCNIAVGDKNIVVPNVNKTKRVRNLDSKLKHLHKVQSRKYNKNGRTFEKTNNIIKVENEIRKVYYHLKKIRKNYTHQMTTMIANLYPKSIVMEDLNVMGLIKNKHLSKYIQEQYFYEFKRQMEYKAKDRGIEFILADRFYPSSKTCSCCGNIKKDLRLSDRTYICEKCGLTIDRDYNAAINLMRYSKH